MDLYVELLQKEVSHGERTSWVLRWFLYGTLFILCLMVFVLQKDRIGLYGMLLTSLILFYNLFLIKFLRENRTDIWIRYTSVTVDVVLLSLYNAMDAYINSPLVPVTTATLLLYPVIIFLASLRLDRALIVYATLLSVASMNLLFFLALPHFDPVIARKLVCGDVLGQIYRTVYILLLGFLILIVPRIIVRLLKEQQGMLEQSQEYFRKAHHDNLTGLANRRLLTDYLLKMLPLAERKGSNLALIYMDLDGFKPINDTLGHEAGDQVLIEIARRIQTVVRESDLVARVGGDEFVAVAIDVEGREGARQVCDRLLEAIRRPILLEAGPRELGASLGVALFPEHGNDEETLIQLADSAMYHVKKSGKNAIGFA